MVFFLVLLTFTVFIAAGALLERRRKREAMRVRAPRQWDILDAATAPVVRSMAGLFYHSGHTWTFLDPSGEASMGIDDFAQGVIGKISHIEFPEPGTRLRQGEKAFTVIQKNKRIDFVSPLDGIVKSVNESAAADTEMIKRLPYTRGWLLTVDPNNLIQNLKRLKVGQEALDWLGRETKRFVEFLSLHAERPQEVGVTMHDGGLFIEGVVENIDGELLEILTRKFFR